MADTIFAPATASGRAGVGIIRISGPRAHAIGRNLCGSLPEPRVAALRSLRDADGAVIDQALVLVFAAGASFTGEDVVELHHHGSVAVVARVLDVLSAQDGARPAKAGEFTRRSLDNGVLDLSQVEGLADLIDAETEEQRRQALRVMDGELSRLVQGWRRDLQRSAALIEATIDFADEDVPVNVWPEVRQLLSGVALEIADQLSGADAARQVQTGFEVAIVGRPNSGKSSLINRLSRRDIALTSDIAGTTRDVIEARLVVAGQLVTFLDTAGLRETEDVVERLGIDRARSRAATADLRIFLLEQGQSMPDSSVAVLDGDIILIGKDDDGDLGGISSRTGVGIDTLLETIADRLRDLTSGASLLIRERHKVAMDSSASALRSALIRLEQDEPLAELVAADVRTGITALDELIGRIGVEDVLGEIFSSFCIGK